MGEPRNPSDPDRQGLEAEKWNENDDKCELTADINDNKNETTNANDRGVRMRFRARPAGVVVVDEDQLGLNRDDDDDGDNVLPSWDAVLWRGRLYVYVSARQLCEGSKVNIT